MTKSKISKKHYQKIRKIGRQSIKKVDEELKVKWQSK